MLLDLDKPGFAKIDRLEKKKKSTNVSAFFYSFKKLISTFGELG